jgi:integrase/recombinase XerD
MLLAWQRHLFHRRTRTGAPLSFRSQHHLIGSARLFFAWATREGFVLANPASELELPRLEHRIPRPALSIEQAEAILAVPDTANPVGLRDRAMLEVFYATGIRRAELAHLHVADVDVQQHTLFVRHGKGGKDRLIPLGARAATWVQKYRLDARPQLATGTLGGHVPAWSARAPDGGGLPLFLTVDGTALALDYLTRLVREYIAAAGIDKPGSCHLFRHTLATVMLDGGADLRYVQQMLGHSDIAATQLYTHVAIAHLAAVHAATHPATTHTSRTDRDADANAGGDGSSDDLDAGQVARAAALARAGRRLSATDLLAVLEQEIDLENRPPTGSPQPD